jgi:hypothetical protein
MDDGNGTPSGHGYAFQGLPGAATTPHVRRSRVDHSRVQADNRLIFEPNPLGTRLAIEAVWSFDIRR